MTDRSGSGERFVLAGWVLFLVGCLMFIVAGIRSGDVIATVASGLFFLGCVFFLIPMFRKP